jgi:RimJ/RimL family protein N-acetyltransferase
MAFISQDLVLENDRVKLRLLKESDFEHLLPFALNEPDLWRFSLFSPAGAENLKQYISDAIKGFSGAESFPFIIFDKKTGAYAGSSRYYDIQPAQKSLQIGYTWYGKAFQGTGLNKNCKLLLLQYAFEDLAFERVEFRADANNSRSVAAMKSIGCTAEGILRSHVEKHGGGRRDSIILSILREEWFNSVKEKLQLKIKNLL